jgi:hypothetical protein
MSFRSSSVLAVSLVLVLAACGGAPASTPASLASDDVPTFAPEVTNPGIATEQPGETTAANDLGNGRPVDITLTLAGTRDTDGTYHATGISRACGNAMVNMTGNMRAFNFEFPFEATPEVEDVSFAAEDLVAGSTTSSFHVDVTVIPMNGMPSLVIDTTDSGPAGHTGTAQRTEANGTTTLVVEAADDLGVSLHLTATCGPRAG